MNRILPACLLLVSLNSHGALHKWVDANGNVHYSDEPPPANVKGTMLKAQPAPAAPAAKTTAERDAEYKKTQKAKQEADQKSATQQENALARQKNCEAAQQNLRALEAGGRMAVYDDKGERSFLDDAGRQQRIGEARRIIATDCK